MYGFERPVDEDPTAPMLADWPWTHRSGLPFPRGQLRVQWKNAEVYPVVEVLKHRHRVISLVVEADDGLRVTKIVRFLLLLLHSCIITAYHRLLLQ
jgi:hypothetical protein